MPWGWPRGASLPAKPLARKPLVSVGIPCFNYARYLPAAVGSVLGQREVELELIIVDDGSSDDTASVAASLAAADARIQLRSHDRNHGHIASFNELLEVASGEYIVILSADDLLTPGSLARATALLEARPDVGLAYGRVVTFSGLEPPAANGRLRGWTVWRGHDWIKARCRLGLNAVWSPELVMRASVQRAIGEYRSDLPRTADFEMWLRAASISNVGRVDGVAQAFYRLHPDSMTSTIHADWRIQMKGYLDAFATLAQSGLLTDGERLFLDARRALALNVLRQARREYHRPPVDDATTRELMEFARTLFPEADRLAQWRSMQWRRWLLGRWPAALEWAAAPALEALSHVEDALHWRWLRLIRL